MDIKQTSHIKRIAWAVRQRLEKLHDRVDSGPDIEVRQLANMMDEILSVLPSDGAIRVMSSVSLRLVRMDSEHIRLAERVAELESKFTAAPAAPAVGLNAPTGTPARAWSADEREQAREAFQQVADSEAQPTASGEDARGDMARAGMLLSAEQIVVCLQDDIAALRDENQECEIATNMEAAAELIEDLADELTAMLAAQSASAGGW